MTVHHHIARLALLLSLAIALIACAQPLPAVPTPPAATAPAASVGTSEPTTTLPPQPRPADQVWQRVEEAGVLIVGTSADYAPFAYYTPEFDIDGFDIALIKALANDLGLEVVVRDYAFEGLFGALQLNQIDAAIAAISVRPERDAQADFSHVYYAGENALLARKDGKVDAVSAVGDLAGLRLGVQQGSVYETWAQQELVASGLSDASNIFSYLDINQAVADLAADRLDAMMLDALPAQAIVAQDPGQGLEVVAQGLEKQMFAIALRNGAYELQAQLNAALDRAVEAGVLADLSEQYLQLQENELMPTPTLAPDTPIPPRLEPECIDDMRKVGDLTLDDQNMTAPPSLAPGHAFSKAWQLENTGTCVWDDSYSLSFAHGNNSAASMGGLPKTIQGLVEPGATYDLQVSLFAPFDPGVYQGFWQMRNGQGVPFGEKVWVGVQIPAPVESAAPGEGGSAPILTLTIDPPATLAAGQCARLAWTVTGAVEVVRLLRNDITIWESAPTSGNFSDCPPGTGRMTYTLKAESAVGTSQLTQAVRVVPAQN